MRLSTTAHCAATALLLLMLGGLVACTQEPAATAITPLPALARPTVTLKVPQDVARQTRILIPRSAYIERGGLPGVFVLQQGEARFRMVHIGKTSGSQLEVLSGLDGNETLILGKLEEVRDGSPITVK